MTFVPVRKSGLSLWVQRSSICNAWGVARGEYAFARNKLNYTRLTYNSMTQIYMSILGSHVTTNLYVTTNMSLRKLHDCLGLHLPPPKFRRPRMTHGDASATCQPTSPLGTHVALSPLQAQCLPEVRPRRSWRTRDDKELY